MISGNQLVRWSTVAVVTGIASVAAWVSYEHALAVVRAHGETGAVGYAYPATIDPLIYAASMVLLDSAWRGLHAPVLARWLLAIGIAATLSVNIVSGLKYGAMGSVVAAWPALALVGAYELLMLLIRREAAPAGAALDFVTEVHPDAVTGSSAVHPGGVTVTGGKSGRERTRKSAPKSTRKVDPRVHYADMLAAEKLPSARAIARDIRVGQAKAGEIRKTLAASRT